MLKLLRTGIYLLTSSSVGVFYHQSNMEGSTHLVLHWACMIGLTISLTCFVVAYFKVMRPHMIKSEAWKPS
jgi:hypothetical protein